MDIRGNATIIGGLGFNVCLRKNFIGTDSAVNFTSFLTGTLTFE